MSRFGGVAVVLVVGFALAACGGDSTGADAPPAESAASLRDMLQANGLTCRHFEQVPANQRKVGAKDQGGCEENGEDVTLLTFISKTRRDAYIDAIRRICPLLKKDLGISGPMPMVLGPNWLVTPRTRAVATRIAKAVDADTKTVRC